MSQQIIPAADLIHDSWQNYRRHWMTYLEFGVWYLVLSVTAWAVDMAARTWADSRLEAFGYKMLGLVPITLLSLYVTMVFIRIIWAHLKESEVSIPSFLDDSRKRFWTFVTASILVVIATFGGFLLLLVPGIILYVRYRFFAYYVIIEGKPVMESISLSSKLSRGRFWPIIWRLIAISVFFLAAASLLSTIMYALLGTALGDVGRYFGEISFMFNLSGKDLLAMSVIPQLSMVVFMPMIMAGELRLWDELKTIK